MPNDYVNLKPRRRSTGRSVTRVLFVTTVAVILIGSLVQFIKFIA